MTAIEFQTHDHSGCIASALSRAEAHCAREKLQFTAIRRRVLEILLQDHRALGAYDILGTLSAEGLGAKPPTAYRALDFLVKHGLAHRIERLNAYTACARPDRDHVPAFLICRACGAVAEAETELTQGRLGQAAEGSGFTIEQVVVEAEGLCPACTGGDT